MVRSEMILSVAEGGIASAQFRQDGLMLFTALNNVSRPAAG